MELRVVLAIVGILTFQFCLFYIEHNTNKGEDANKCSDLFYFLLSMSSLLISVGELVLEMF